MAKRSQRKNYDEEGKGNTFKPFTAKTDKQKEYFKLINSHQITIAHGAAGTGKSHVALASAAEAIYYGEISKIVITKPLVEAQEHLGYLPGNIDEKQLPYLLPVKYILNDLLGKSFVENLIRNGQIEVVPLAYMRGLTFKDSFVILDEAQNTTPGQMKLILTRLNQDSKLIINGDSRQVDIKGANGLEDAIKRLKWVPGIAMIEFDRNDCVRADIISDIISAYED
jgi:phosphate starvation-inducible PhoH-like protein